MPQETKTVEKDREKQLEEENASLKAKYEARIASLERMVGQQTKETEREKTKAEKAEDDADTKELMRTMIEEIQYLKNKEGSSADEMLKNITGLAIAIASDNRIAKAVGATTGVNMAVIKTEFERVLSGEISLDESVNLIDNAWAIVKGYVLGDEGMQRTLKELDSEKRKRINQMSDELNAGED